MSTTSRVTQHQHEATAILIQEWRLFDYLVRRRTFQHLFMRIDNSGPQPYCEIVRDRGDNSLVASAKAPMVGVHRRVARFVAATVLHPARQVPLRPRVVLHARSSSSGRGHRDSLMK